MTAKTPRKTTPKKSPPRKRVDGKVAPQKPEVSGNSAAMRRKLFVEAYLSSGESITKAALAAGFSPKTAAQQGSRLLKNVEVQHLIQQRRTEVVGAALAKTQLTIDVVLKSLAQAVMFDPRKLYREDGTLKAITELDDDTAQALSGMEISEEFGPEPAADKKTELEAQAHGGALKRESRRVIASRTAKVKWLDKNTAREQALRHMGLFDKDNRQRTDPLSDLLAELQKTRSAVPIASEDPEA